MIFQSKKLFIVVVVVVPRREKEQRWVRIPILIDDSKSTFFFHKFSSGEFSVKLYLLADAESTWDGLFIP